MEKEKFDRYMTAWGWIPKGNKPMELASDNPDTDWKGIDAAHKYSHKAGFTICVDDEEISKVSADNFEEWLEKSSQPYITSRLYAFARGSRYKSDDGEYINAMGYNKNYMKLQIERLTERDDYILKKSGIGFDWKKFRFIYKVLFFKSKPKIIVE